MMPIGTSAGGELSVEATVDIGGDTVTLVGGTQAVTQAVGDATTGLEGAHEETAAMQSEFHILWNQKHNNYSLKVQKS